MSGNTSTSSCVGGLVGYGGGVSNSYATGAVTGQGGLGGLIGCNGSSVTNSFWNTQTTGQSTSDGSGGSYYGRTTAELSSDLTFLNTNWDFAGESTNGSSEVWQMPSGGGLPTLAWQGGSAASLSPTSKPSGSGTSGSPYLISTAAQIVWLQANSARLNYSHIKLTADIDVSTLAGSLGILAGTSVFDGNGYSLSNFTLNKPTTDYVGLFSQIESGSTVKNLRLINFNVTGKNNVGSLIGYSNGTVQKVSASGSVAGERSVGGLIGNQGYDGLTTQASSSVNVTGTEDYIGGLIGYRNGGGISNSYATGAVSGNTSTSSCVGGLLGEGGGVSYSYATGAVTGQSSLGGLIGCSGSSVTNSFWNTQTTGQSTSNGSGGTYLGKTTSQMKQQATFTSWDFTNNWTISEGSDYPRLRN